MARTDTAPAPTVGVLREQAAQAWRNLAPRERRGLLMAGLAIGLLLLWMIAVRPAWQVLRTAPAQLASLEAQAQEMQRLAAESRTLRDAAPVSPAAATAALRAASDRLGPAARLQLQGERATLSFDNLPAPRLAAWLAEARSGARARPTEANLTRGTQGYSGTITVVTGPAS
jgi:general secretion pathway protein M